MAAAPTQSSSSCSFLGLQQAQLTLVSGQRGAWKLPVRQWECTTRKDKLEDEMVTGKRGCEICHPFSQPPVFRVDSSQHNLQPELTKPLMPRHWEPDLSVLTPGSAFENCWSSLTSSMQN